MARQNAYWTPAEHSEFERLVILHGWGNWKQIAEHIPTRARLQVKSHAQKFAKVRTKEKDALVQKHALHVNGSLSLAALQCGSGTVYKARCGQGAKRKSGSDGMADGFERIKPLRRLAISKKKRANKAQADGEGNAKTSAKVEHCKGKQMSGDETSSGKVIDNAVDVTAIDEPSTVPLIAPVIAPAIAPVIASPKVATAVDPNADVVPAVTPPGVATAASTPSDLPSQMASIATDIADGVAATSNGAPSNVVLQFLVPPSWRLPESALSAPALPGNGAKFPLVPSLAAGSSTVGVPYNPALDNLASAIEIGKAMADRTSFGAFSGLNNLSTVAAATSPLQVNASDKGKGGTSAFASTRGCSVDYATIATPRRVSYPEELIGENIPPIVTPTDKTFQSAAGVSAKDSSTKSPDSVLDANLEWATDEFLKNQEAPSAKASCNFNGSANGSFHPNILSKVSDDSLDDAIKISDFLDPFSSDCFSLTAEDNLEDDVGISGATKYRPYENLPKGNSGVSTFGTVESTLHRGVNADKEKYNEILDRLTTQLDENAGGKSGVTKGAVIRKWIKQEILTNHEQVEWWKYCFPIDNHESRSKKDCLENLIALSKVLVDVKEWHVIPGHDDSFSAEQRFDEEVDIRHVSQMLTGLWERVNRSLSRDSYALLSENISNRVERNHAILKMVGVLGEESHLNVVSI